MEGAFVHPIDFIFGAHTLFIGEDNFTDELTRRNVSRLDDTHAK